MWGRFSSMVGLGGILVALSGCGGINLVASEETAIYDLSPKSTFDEGLPTVEAQLVVDEPTASRTIDTDRIAIRQDVFQVGYFKGVRWSDRTTLMFQTRLIESFENTGKIAAVGRKAIGLMGNYDLLTELREFEARLIPGEEPRVLVVANAKLISQPTARIVASETFNRSIPARSEKFEDIIVAYDEALGGVLKRMVSWSITQIDTAERNRRRAREAVLNGQ